MKKYFIYRYSYTLSPGFQGLPWYSKGLEAYTPIGYDKRAREEFGESAEFVTEFGIYWKPIGDGDGFNNGGTPIIGTPPDPVTPYGKGGTPNE